MHIKTPREAAWQWLNTKVDTLYIWGGNEVKDGGFDCSGLANGALRKFDITFQDHTAADLARMFPTVKKEHLQYGDLLFWRSKTSDKIVHVEVVWARLGDNIYTIGASGGGPWTTTRTAAMKADARVKIHKAPAGWAFARNPYGD